MQFFRLKSAFSIAFLACALTPAFAGNQTVSFAGNDTASFIGTRPILQGGIDSITFDGIGAGTYDFELTLSGSFIHLSSLGLNGEAGTVESNGRFLFADVVGVGSAPFVLTLDGIALAAQANYSGQLALTAVDEPHNLALLLAGLPLTLLAASRRGRR